MKKIAGVILLAAAVVLFVVLSGFHRIETGSDSRYIESCPRYARTGETVTVHAAMVTDADLYFYVDGAEVQPLNPGVYQFVMPDHKVRISITVRSNGLA